MNKTLSFLSSHTVLRHQSFIVALNWINDTHVEPKRDSQLPANRDNSTTSLTSGASTGYDFPQGLFALLLPMSLFRPLGFSLKLINT